MVIGFGVWLKKANAIIWSYTTAWTQLLKQQMYNVCEITYIYVKPFIRTILKLNIAYDHKND